jgi:succinoglycan biosynthesis transport protein ExoP
MEGNGTNGYHNGHNGHRNGHHDETTTREVLNVLFRRKLVILVVVVVATALTVGRSLNEPKIYWSATQVLLQGGQRTSALETRTVYRPFDEVMNSELNIAVSQPVVERAKKILAEQRSQEGHPVNPDDVEINTNYLEAYPEGISSVLWIRYGSTDRSEAREVVTAITQAYIDVHRELFRLPDARDVIEENMARTETELHRLMEERRDFLYSQGLFAGEQEKAELVTSLERHEAELLTLRSQIAGQEESTRSLEQAMASRLPEEVPLVKSNGDDAPNMALARLGEELVSKRASRREMLLKYQEGHREVQALDESIAALRDELERGLETELHEQRAQLGVLKAREKVIVAGLDDLKKRLSVMPEVERRLEDYNRRIGTLETYYKDFQHGEFSLTLNEVTGRDFEAMVLSGASHPQASNPRDVVRLALGPVLGLLVGVGLALFLERMDHAVHTPEDVEDFMDLPVIASVSEAPWRVTNGGRRGVRDRLRSLLGRDVS